MVIRRCPRTFRRIGQDKIVHATLAIGEVAVLMGADVPPEAYRVPQGFSVMLAVDDVAEAERVFQALAEHGRIEMPLRKTFWSSAFGVLVDRFGTPWEIQAEQADR